MKLNIINSKLLIDSKIVRKKDRNIEYRKVDKEKDIQKHRQTDRQIDRHKDRQIDRKKD